MFLLDVNILLALADPDHVHHSRAESFFLAHQTEGWATCPLTENGFVRILGASSYPKSPGVETASIILRQLCSQDGHRFWPDDLSLRSMNNLPLSKHLTDHYLLSLAIYRQGKFVSLDSRIKAALIPGGLDAYVVI